MTFWDFLCAFVEKGGLAWSLLAIVCIGLVWIIAHPSVAKEWNTQISLWVASIVPRKRKRAFEKKLNLTIDSAKRRFSKTAPQFMKKFLPYDLKVKWVNDGERRCQFPNSYKSKKDSNACCFYKNIFSSTAFDIQFLICFDTIIFHQATTPIFH